MAVWRLSPGEATDHARQLVAEIRDGCVRRRYWLRAYAALPGKLALLLYPLENPTVLLARFAALAGGPPARLRVIRTDAELDRAATYVESLPVRSHLSNRPEEYPFSSLGWIGADQLASVKTPHGP